MAWTCPCARMRTEQLESVNISHFDCDDDALFALASSPLILIGLLLEPASSLLSDSWPLAKVRPAASAFMRGVLSSIGRRSGDLGVFDDGLDGDIKVVPSDLGLVHFAGSMRVLVLTGEMVFTVARVCFDGGVCIVS